MSIDWTYVTVSASGRFIGLWNRGSPSIATAEGILIDVQSGQVAARTTAHIMVSPISWSGSDHGAYSEYLPWSGSLISRISTIDPDTLAVAKVCDLEDGVVHVHWLSDTSLALTTLTGGPDEHPTVDLYVLDLASNDIARLTELGDVLCTPVQRVGDEVWCVRRMPAGDHLYSATSGRTQWSPRSECDLVYSISQDGRILILHWTADRNNPPRFIGASAIDATSGTVIWSKTADVISAAFGPSGKLGFTVASSGGRYELIEVALDDGREQVMVRSDSKIHVVGWSIRGWVIVEDQEVVSLVADTGSSRLFP